MDKQAQIGLGIFLVLLFIAVVILGAFALAQRNSQEKNIQVENRQESSVNYFVQRPVYEDKVYFSEKDCDCNKIRHIGIENIRIAETQTITELDINNIHHQIIILPRF